MNKVESTHLTIKFFDCAYKLVEFAENHSDNCPEKSMYLSHGYYLQLKQTLSGKILLRLFKKDSSISYDKILMYPESKKEDYNYYKAISHVLRFYISCIEEDEVEGEDNG